MASYALLFMVMISLSLSPQVDETGPQANRDHYCFSKKKKTKLVCD